MTMVLGDEPDSGRPTVTRKRPDVPPPYIHVENRGGTLTLRWRWFGCMTLLLTGFAIFWILFMFRFASSILADAVAVQGWRGGLPLLFCPPFWVGLLLIYNVLARYVNQTQLTVDGKEIRIQHGPLPWGGIKRLPVTEITQIYTKRRPYRKLNGDYAVFAILRQSYHQKLLSDLDSSEHALFVEQEIERFLGIEDRPVEGEYGRK